MIDGKFDTDGFGNDIRIQLPGVIDNIGYIKVYNVGEDSDLSMNRSSLKNYAVFTIIDEFGVPREFTPSPFNGDGEILNVYTIQVNTSNLNLLTQISDNQADYLRTLDPDDVLLPYRISQGTHNSSVLSNPANSLNYLTIFNNQNAIEYLPTSTSTSSSLTNLEIEATTIPNTLITDNKTDVLTLKNTSCNSDARIVLGNTCTGHPDASANYAAIGGEYAKPDDNKYGKMNFYIRDNSTDLIQVATIDSSGLSIEDISANTITSQSAIIEDISVNDIRVNGRLSVFGVLDLSNASLEADASNIDISCNGTT